ncbi:putative lectin-like domain protein [Caulobacter phage CcrSwift]|uniref:receptor protein-tyrosine kinase n=1 Tax=Caulobacter phage CcrSwift TaxID=2927984 RepID=K4K730_9CAUD|nr:putative lectin-like domain protein [Caulobacter phage CcrSwift]AFU88392.1 putative lectin-like domain protein [Caulobacter phage CcrSwift]
MVDIVAGTPVSVSYSGASTTYVAAETGLMTVHLWGGAGAGGYYANGAGNPNKYGGAGGYATLNFLVQEGDVLTIEVGQGGQVPTGSGTTVTAGGSGGWPDGGYGGKSTSAWVGLGGGGGSTRLYRNGELIGVAGGGGGATGFYHGGNGGGMVGLASADASSGAGGTQSAGGTAGSGTLAIQTGLGFQGGRGGATASTAHAYAGGGGGGGLYGGASNGGGSGAHGSGGGGSGYINQNLLYSGRLQAGRIDALGVPFDVAGIRPAGVAEGGTGPTVASTGWGSITPGGDGFAYLSLTSVASATAFPTSGTTTLAYSGSRQVYTVTQLSTVDIEMWGGGGGGGFYTSGGASPRYGGAGGYTKFTKVLFPGDIVEIEVGQGGQAPTGVGGNIGGFGGWPNGGDGGRSSVNSATNMGGGGGSTNIYVNGRLLGVASGGGGSTGFYNGGNGGGKWGLADAAAASGTAGTWARDNSTGTGLGRGFFLRGGHGSPNESRDVAHPNAGAGGGGGYWGGGGARGGSGTHGAGGGGCGFINGDLTWNRDYQWGTQGTGQPYTGGAYTSGVAVGGTSGNTAGSTTNGGDGQIVFTVTAASTTTLPSDKNALTYSGAVQHYVVPTAGVIDLKMWGSGGGSAVRSTGTPGRGGGGGCTQVPFIPIKPGDIVTFAVGQGGRGAVDANSISPGGWPNGGYSGPSASAGGGGASLCYLNGELVAVAGSGAGAGISNGGFAGGAASCDPGYVNFTSHGGTQTTAGWCPTRVLEGTTYGTYMLGGDGQIDGVAPNNVNVNTGGGGGGGYYGGGGNATNSSRYWGGGGGSGYINPKFAGTIIGATSVNAANNTDPDYVAGVGVAGVGSTTYANPVTNGGDGRIVFTYDTPPNLVESLTTAVPVDGAVKTYIVGADGDLVLDLWGGGGGAATILGGGGSERGGGGGYVGGTYPVTAGQVIRFYNGRGGGGGVYTSGTATALVGTGGPSGWPDGGAGGYYAGAGSNGILAGAGGGSSRVYVDDQLILVAGGGGGGGAGTTTTTPGGGGGSTGGDSDAPAGRNFGATQARGGYNSNRPTDTVSSGGLFRGGAGYLSGGSSSISAQSAGGGGGGGLFGGGGSGSSVTYIGGSGGSGFIFDGLVVSKKDPYRADVIAQMSFESGAVVADGRVCEIQPIDTPPTAVTTSPKYGAYCGNYPGSGHSTMPVPAFGLQNFTIEAWFNPSSLGNGVLFAYGNSGVGGFSLHYASTTLYLRHNGDAATDVTWADTGRTANVWAHYAVVRDMAGTRVYKDGRLVMSYANSIGTTFTATQLTLANYTGASGASTRFSGRIDEFRATLGACRYVKPFVPSSFAAPLSTPLPTLTTITQAPQGSSGNAANNTDTNYIAGRGVGAQTRQTAGTAPSGGDGQISYFIATSTISASGPIGTVTVSGLTDAAAGAFYPLPGVGSVVVEPYTGARVNYEVTEAVGARIKVEMWGGGGGGSSANTALTTNGGGGGGYTVIELDLVQGDRITVQTPSGGAGGVNAGSGSAINLGGYPDGGDGYRPAFTALNCGGGGSARLWAQGNLAAVAGGGGGAAYGGGGYDFPGGAGGGNLGGPGAYDGVNAPFPNGGGTQIAGGAGTANGFNGASLQGGHGGVTPSVANNGCGGGGGYYGGGGGGAYKAGGGGSGYVNTGLPGYRTGSTTGGSGNLPAGMSSPNYVSGIGVGSNGKGGAFTNGGNGRIVISVITPTPGNASGSIGTVNVSGLDEFGLLIGVPTGDLDTIDVVVPVGQSGQPGFAEGPLTTIGVGPAETIPQAQAVVIVPINDQTSILIEPPINAPLEVPGEGIGELDTILVSPFDSTQTAGVAFDAADVPTITLVAPEAEAVEIPPVLTSGDIGTVIVTAPEATTQVIPPVETSGDIGTITVVTVTGEASWNNNVSASGDIGTIIVTVPDVVAVGDDLAEGLIGTITVIAPEGVALQDANVAADIGTISVYPIEGGQPGDAVGDIPYIQVVTPGATVNASSGDDISLYADIGTIYVLQVYGQGFWISEDNYVHALPDPLIVTTTAPEGSARGDVHIVQVLPTIVVTPPAPAATGEGFVDGYTGDFIILVDPPVPLTELNANVNVAMPPPIVINGNDAETSLDVTIPFSDTAVFVSGPEALGLGFHGGEMGPPILVTPPEGGPEISVEIFVDPGTILVEAPRFHYIPPITVLPPEGVALDAHSAEASGDLGTITIGVPTGGYQANVAINLPLPTIFVNVPQVVVFASVAVSGDVGTITLTPPDATLTAGVDASFALPGPIVVSTPEATATAGSSAATSGALGTITITPPEGLVSTGTAAATSGAIGTIVVSPFDGSVFISYPGNASGAIGTIIVTPPAASLTHGHDLSIALPGPIIITAPEAQPQAGATVSGDIGTIIVTPLDGHATGDTVLASGDIGTIVVSTPDGEATGRGLGSGAIGTIVITPPAATLTAEANKAVALPGPIIVTPLTGVGQVPAAAAGDLATITITSVPEATLSIGQDISGQIGTITVTPPEAFPQGSVFVDPTDEMVVQLLPPQAILFQEATVIVGFPTVYLIAPEAITYSLAEFASITLLPPDAYVDVPLPLGKNRIRYRRNNTAGLAPTSLRPNEIALNETDGLLFTRDGSGAVKATPLGFLTGAGVPPPVTDNGKVLSGGLSWETPNTRYLLPVRNAPPAGTRIALGEGVVGVTTFTPTVDVTYTRPFFVAKTIDIQALSVDVVGAAAATAELGLIGWSLSGVPGATLALGTVSTATTGIKTATGTAVTLTPGWYASTFKVTGAAGAAFRAPTAPTAIAPDFTVTPGAPAPVMADLEA